MFSILGMFDTHLCLLLLPFVKGRFVVPRQVACYATQMLDMLAPVFRANIIELIRISAIQTCIIGHIDCEVRNVMLHRVDNNGFKSIYIVLNARLKLNIGNAPSAAIPSKLTLNVDFLKYAYLLPIQRYGRVSFSAFVRSGGFAHRER